MSETVGKDCHTLIGMVSDDLGKTALGSDFYLGGCHLTIFWVI